VITHGSALELPIKDGKAWRLRMGIKNDYTSKPPAGLTKLDTSYFSQFMFTWQ